MGSERIGGDGGAYINTPVTASLGPMEEEGKKSILNHRAQYHGLCKEQWLQFHRYGLLMGSKGERPCPRTLSKTRVLHARIKSTPVVLDMYIMEWPPITALDCV